jgi:hypothetical protein
MFGTKKQFRFLVLHKKTRALTNGARVFFVLIPPDHSPFKANDAWDSVVVTPL